MSHYQANEDFLDCPAVCGQNTTLAISGCPSWHPQTHKVSNIARSRITLNSEEILTLLTSVDMTTFVFAGYSDQLS